MDFKGNFQGTMIIALLSLFVLSPICYFIMWSLSLFSLPFFCNGRNRHYVQELPISTHQVHQNESMPDLQLAEENKNDNKKNDKDDSVDL